MHGAYESLPDDIKKRIEGRMGIHQRSKPGNPPVGVVRKGGEEYYKRQATKNVLHPIVRTHPVSGRKGLYVSPRFTVGIEGIDDTEAQPARYLIRLPDGAGKHVSSQMDPGRFRDVGQS